MDIALAAFLHPFHLLKCEEAIVDRGVKRAIAGRGAADCASRSGQRWGRGEAKVVITDESCVQRHKDWGVLLHNDCRLEMGWLWGGNGSHAQGTSEGVGCGHLMHVQHRLSSSVDGLLFWHAVLLLCLLLGERRHLSIVLHLGRVTGEMLLPRLRLSRVVCK